jgi:hypothetical protein
MADDLTSGGGSAAFRCPWCSAVLPSTDLEICPSCKATLTSTAEAALPGVTAIDHEAILRAGREPVRQPRSRLFSWLSGEYVEEAAAPGDPQAIAPPDLEVRREILRLEIEAELADRQAEADSILADAAVEGRPLPGPESEAGPEDAESAAVAAEGAEPTEDAQAAEAGATDEAAEAAEVTDEAADKG